MKPLIIAAIGAGSGIALGTGLSVLLNPDNTSIEQLPTTTSPDNQWISWGQSIIDRFGQKQGVALFLSCWNAAKPTIDTSAIRSFFSNNGMSFPNSGIVDAIVDETSSVFHGIGSTIEGIFGVSKIVAIVCVGGVIVAGILIVKGITDNPDIIGKAAMIA